MLVGEPFTAQQPSHPLVRDGRDQFLLQTIPLQLAHRPLREWQAEVFRTAEGDADECPYLLAIDDDRTADVLGVLLEGLEPALVEAMHPVLGLALAAADDA